MEDKDFFENDKLETEINENLTETKNLEKENFSQTEDEKTFEEKKANSKEKFTQYINQSIRTELEKNLKKNRKKNFAKFLLAVLLSSSLSSTATVFYLKNKNNLKENTTSTEAIKINTASEINVEKAVAKKSTNSVVGISTVGITEDIFSRQMQTKGVGSGVIVSEDGYILTNNHVVDPSSTQKVTVLLSDGTKLDANVLWADKTLDLAVIKVDSKNINLKPIEIADSNEVEVGDKSIAIGSPLGLNLQSTLTSGYISGKDRTINLEDGSVMEGLLQTDASINPGNSGGALLNSKGELIGINTAKSGGSDGIGFAIPINVAKPILNQIIKNGKFEMVVLGIRGIDVERYNALRNDKLNLESGVYVHEVLEGYPAMESGIKAKDIIVKIGDTKINSNVNIKNALLNYSVGDSTEITVNREGKEITLKVTFAKMN